MKCDCGEEIGIVTVKTVGLCLKCGRSKWMQAARKFRPDSVRIARKLNDERATQCPCGQNKRDCMSICGVRFTDEGFWTDVSEEIRQAWFEKVIR